MPASFCTEPAGMYGRWWSVCALEEWIVTWVGLRHIFSLVDYIRLTNIHERGGVSFMIKDFACEHTEGLWRNQRHKKLPVALQESALRKLRLIESAESVHDLRLSPGNRLEKLSGSRAGQYSIRINDQFRICFRFEGEHAKQVKIVDYH